MSLIQDRKDRWKQIGWSLLAVVLVVLNGTVIHSTWSLYQKKALAESRLAESKDRLEATTRDVATLEKTVKMLQTKRGVEEVIRRHYSLIKPGETMVTIIENEASATPTATSTIPQKKASWRSWLPWQ